MAKGTPVDDGVGGGTASSDTSDYVSSVTLDWDGVRIKVEDLPSVVKMDLPGSSQAFSRGGERGRDSSSSKGRVASEEFLPLISRTDFRRGWSNPTGWTSRKGEATVRRATSTHSACKACSRR
jgi:hypothetical protein